jgi:RNA polymerase sigma factor (sigma-70 family)
MNIETQLIAAVQIVRRIVRDPTIEMDLYQDLCVACLKSSNIDWSVPQIGRIVRIIQRLNVNRFRRNGRRKECSLHGMEMDQLAHHYSTNLSDPDNYEQLMWAIKALPPRYRRAIEQRYLLEQPDEALAAEFSAHAETIRKWRSRGVQELKKFLSQSASRN